MDINFVSNPPLKLFPISFQYWQWNSNTHYAPHAETLQPHLQSILPKRPWAFSAHYGPSAQTHPHTCPTVMIPNEKLHTQSRKSLPRSPLENHWNTPTIALQRARETLILKDRPSASLSAQTRRGRGPWRGGVWRNIRDERKEKKKKDYVIAQGTDPAISADQMTSIWRSSRAPFVSASSFKMPLFWLRPRGRIGSGLNGSLRWNSLMWHGAWKKKSMRSRYTFSGRKRTKACTRRISRGPAAFRAPRFLLFRRLREINRRTRALIKRSSSGRSTSTRFARSGIQIRGTWFLYRSGELFWDWRTFYWI